MPRLAIRLSRELTNSSVELDGIAIGDSRLGKGIPVDPGEHQLVVRTPDGQSFVKHLRIAETTVERVTIDPPVGFVPVGSTSGTTSTSGSQPLYLDANSNTRTAAWAWIAGGVGIAGVVSASVFWYIRERAIDDLNNGCDSNNVCPTNLKSTQSRGEHVSVAAPIALSIGLVGLGLATYGFLVPEHRSIAASSTSSSNVRLNVACDTHFAGVDVAGVF